MSQRSNIIAAVKYNLQQITTANGYATNVVTVKHRMNVPSEIPAASRTWITFRLGPCEENWTGYFNSGAAMERLTITAILPQANSEETMATRADNILSDLKKRFMQVDPQLIGSGATPNCSSIERTWFDADNADMSAGGDWVEVHFTIKYWITPTS